MELVSAVESSTGTGTPEAARAEGGPAAAFSLHDNPFALLGVTPLTPVHELPDAAARIGTPQAAAAARTLSVPRSRLGAELGFLPGCAATAPVVLGALAHGQRPDPATLGVAARANVVAHLCAIGAASPGEQDRLSRLQPAQGDPALADALDAERAAAGMPPVQRAAMPAEQEALAERHAAALVAGCRHEPDPAARLAALVREAPEGTAAGFMRRAAAAWARQSAAGLSRLEEAAAAAERTARQAPDARSVAALVAAVQAWAALDAPQRASDARAALDHAPALRVLRSWRETGVRLADGGHPGLALPLAETLAACFADLPGEAARLAQDVRDCAGMAERAALAAQLAPLRDQVDRLSDAPDRLAALAVDLEAAPFSASARGVARELWAAFDAAVALCLPSDAPWVVLSKLPAWLADEAMANSVAAALSLVRGLAARAEAAGLAEAAGQMATQRAKLEYVLAARRYAALTGQPKGTWRGAWSLRRRTLAALRTLLPLAQDSQERASLLARERALVKRGRSNAGGLIVLAAVVGAVLGVGWLDDLSSSRAPYRTAAPQSLAAAGDDGAAAPRLSLPAPAPSAPPASTFPLPLAPSVPTASAPAPAPFPQEPAAEPPQAPSDAQPAVPRLAFLTRTTLPERQPPPGTRHVRTVPEVRWCEFNEIRLRAAADAVTNEQQQAGLRPLTELWYGLCRRYLDRGRDHEEVASEAERDRDQLEREGRDMLAGQR